MRDNRAGGGKVEGKEIVVFSDKDCRVPMQYNGVCLICFDQPVAFVFVALLTAWCWWCFCDFVGIGSEQVGRADVAVSRPKSCGAGLVFVDL